MYIAKKLDDELKRSRFNLMMFIVSYIINNVVSGILYDTYVNYLHDVSLSTATSFWAFYGYATFISALLLLFIPKIGYKYLMVACSLFCSLGLFSVVFLDIPFIFSVTTLLALVGVQLHFIMLAPYVATYTEGMGADKIKWYSRTYYCGYIGYFLATYLGGVATVKMFSVFAKITYSQANQFTKFVSDLDQNMKIAYIQGGRQVLLYTAILSLVAIIPVLLIREHREDYIGSFAEGSKSFREKLSDASKILKKKEVIYYLIYWCLISFAMGLFSSYFTVFLNRNLHMDKSTASLLVSISYIAIILFMFLTPLAVKKLGQVGTICFTVLTSIPFMIIIAEGARFGTYMVPVVGMALFMRSGLANLGSPAESSLNMSLVSRELRPAYTSLINILAGLASIVSGNFTGNILFVNQNGYRLAYYIAGALYLIACGFMFFGLWKFNRLGQEEVK